MAHEKFFLRFHLLVLSFIVSMFFLILSPSLISVLLGWDGLGVTSYLLVIYFNRRKSFNAGFITAMTNRVGDCFILIVIALLLQEGQWNLFLTRTTASQAPVYLITILFGLAAMTKRAQVPFSA